MWVVPFLAGVSGSYIRKLAEHELEKKPGSARRQHSSTAPAS